MSEQELVDALDEHDALVAACARGELSFEEFERVYQSFYPRYALDGHEATDHDERMLLLKYEARISLHREVWETVVGQLATDEIAAMDPNRIHIAEAVRRLQALARTYLSATAG